MVLSCRAGRLEREEMFKGRHVSQEVERVGGVTAKIASLIPSSSWSSVEVSLS